MIKIGNNSIKAKGAEAIAKAVENLNSLSNINIGNELKFILGGNFINVEGAQKLLGALKGKKWLTSLNMENNDIDEDGAEKIMEYLIELKSLTNLYIGK